MNKKSAVILIIEDETLLLQAITKKIQLSGMECVSCTTCAQAFDYLQNLPELPDAIWLDYYLKDKNGLEFMTELKANPKWEHIPVLVVSNSASPTKVHTMLALGVKKYVLKAEHRLEEIVSIIESLAAENQ